MSAQNPKQLVHDFWNQASCGETLYLKGTEREAFELQSRERYRLEGELISGLAGFDDTRGRKVLEIGVGLGADHQRFAEAGAELYGIDLTERAVEHTQRRLDTFGLSSSLAVGDAEHLDFPDNYFDVVYSWGVLHHSPDTPAAVNEVYRVLKPGGEARIMIYHKWSVIGFMLWTRYGLLRGRPWTGLAEIYSSYLESPGTKAYTIREAEQLFAHFRVQSISTSLTHGDLLESPAGQRHQGVLLSLARKIWPRWFIRFAFPKAGLFMLIQAVKQGSL